MDEALWFLIVPFGLLLIAIVAFYVWAWLLRKHLK